jgi:hypothetical protein
MERRSLVALLVALFLLVPTAVPLAAQPGQASLRAGQRDYSLVEALEFLRHGYTDPGAVTDPLQYARDLRLRGELLACFLRHSAELSRAGFFEIKDAASRQAVLASLNPAFVAPELAADLTPKDILALHAVVFATAGPAVFDQFLAEHVAGPALEGKRYAYLCELRNCVLETDECLREVRDLSGMYGPAGVRPAASVVPEKRVCSATPQADHKCSGTCQTDGAKCAGTCATDGKCSGTCASKEGEAKASEHQCSGTCQTEGGKCTGTCAGKEGEAKASEHKCSGDCAGHEGGDHKCTGNCQAEGKCLTCPSRDKCPNAAGVNTKAVGKAG